MKCPTCGHRVRVQKNLTPGDDTQRECPECGDDLEKSSGRNSLIQK